MTYNPYITQVADQEGIREYDVRNALRQRTPKKREFPCEINGVIFNSKKEYEEALWEFLNSNWIRLLSLFVDNLCLNSLP